MKCTRRVVSVCLAAGMAIGSAVPALALENEFHGMFRSQFINSNFTGAPSTGGVDNDSRYAPAFGYDGSGNRLPAKAPIANLTEQRARLYYTAKINDDLKIVTKWELDYAYWGNSSYNTANKPRNTGGALGGDSVQMETKNVYVDLNLPSVPVNLKVGMQPYNDAFKGFVVDADMAGVLVSGKKDNLSGSVGYFRWEDRTTGTGTLGKKTQDFIALDTKYALSNSANVGFSYYLLDNKLDGLDLGGVGANASVKAKLVHMLGVNGEASFGPVSVDGFFLYQNGTLTDRHVSAFAADAAGKMKVGPGTAHVEAMYVSGDKGDGTSHGFVVAEAPLGAESDVDTNMALLTRNKFGMTMGTAIVYDVNNFDQGVIGGFVGYDLPLSEKLSASTNAGFAAVAQANGNPNQGSNKSDYLGTELNLELAYKLNPNVKLTAFAGYVFLGDYYNGVAAGGKTPDNPYDARLVLNVTF